MLYLILLVFVSVLPSYAGIGYNNFMISVGGGYSTGYVSDHYERSTNGYYVDIPTYTVSGGTFTTELGYLLQGVTYKRGVVNSFEIRGNFSMFWGDNIAYSDPFGSISQKTQKMSGGAMISYGLGVITEEDISEHASRLVFDITGIGFSKGISEITRSLRFNDKNKKGKSKNFSSDCMSIDFMLPGLYYLHRSGLMMGLRNILQIDLDITSYNPTFNYKFNAYVGFVFGK